MEYIKATSNQAKSIYELVQNTIKTIYPRYYPQEVVDFFCNHHNIDNIIADIKDGHTYILLDNDNIIGTGSCIENHITRVFVSPDCQGNGFGSYIMTQLEKEISKKYSNILLDASLSASRLYEHRGYTTISHKQIEVGNGRFLVYEVMKKELPEYEFIIPPNHINFKAKKLFSDCGKIIDGSIAYISLNGGGPVKQHTHEYNHLFIVVQGEAKILLADKTIVVKKNESFLVNGTIPHSVWNNSDGETTMIGITIS